MTRFCPKCKSALVNDSKSKYPRYRRCKKCEYKEYYSTYKEKPKQDPNFKIIKEPKEIAKRKEPERLPTHLEKPSKKYIKAKMTEADEEELLQRIEGLKKWRKEISIQKILRKLRKNKYSGLKGQKINIEGKLYEV